MEVILSCLAGALVAASVYLFLSRTLLRVLFGIILITNAANLAIFAAGRVTIASPPLIPAGLSTPLGNVANPLPQALILTAIVIGFGIYAFALVLIFRAQATLGTLAVEEMSEGSDEIR